jgi:hypothetical protein
MGIPGAGPAVEYSKPAATFDKSSFSKNSGSESEETVELKRAKEVRNLEGVDGATETVPGGVGAGKERAKLETGVPIIEIHHSPPRLRKNPRIYPCRQK